MSRRGRFAPLSVVIASLLFSVALSASAALPDAVVAAFRGKVVLTRGPLPKGANDKDTIAKIKAAQVAELTGTPGDEGQTWTFHYAVFPKKTGNVALKLQFVSGELDGRLAAETSLSIFDVDSPSLQGTLTIGESRGLTRGKAYQLRVVNDKGEVVAKTSAIFK
ncbi:MAG TPA: hypothetical protein VHK47_03490 [Polyangia bacterium]|jgi:hypothetical protein|nr:hypothetical protein [Polyangia bacterium]